VNWNTPGVKRMKRVKLWKLDEDFAGENLDPTTRHGRREEVESDGMKAWEEAFLDGWDNAR